MTAEEIRELLDASPFKPFNVHLDDGMSFKIEHPDFAMFHPNYRSLAVYSPRLQQVSVAHIARLETLAPAPQE